MAKIKHRFSKSFTLGLIGHYLAALIVLILLEAGGRLGLMAYRFATEGEAEAHNAAERLAADVYRIMINRGGPVAASTVYPILQRSFGAAGLHIAIVPSKATVSSIEKQYGFTPKGLPPSWPDGWYNGSAVELTAQDFCLRCHVDATRGDVLGTVAIRNYFASRLATFWQETQVLGLVAMANVILATVLLFFLLRQRIQPLLAMDEIMDELAKASAPMTKRVAVHSRDEFGRLAYDANRLLDRVGEVAEDLGHNVDSFIRLLQYHSLTRQHLEQYLDDLQQGFGAQGTGEASASPLGAVDVVVAWLEVTKLLGDALARLAEADRMPGDMAGRADELHRRLLWIAAEARNRGGQPNSSGAAEIRSKVEAAKACCDELRYLEESMQHQGFEGDQMRSPVSI